MTPGNEKYVHHWILNECGSPYETEYLTTYSKDPEPGLIFKLF